MNRRSLLRGVAAATAGSAATAAGLRLSDRGRAEAATTLEIAGDRATLGPDGDLTAVELAADVGWAYELPAGRSPETVIVELAAGKRDAELSVVDSTERAELFPEASGEESLSAELLAQGVLDAAALTPADGERATDVVVEARLRVENGDGDVLASAESRDTATVSVERDTVAAEEYGDVGGSGSLTLETA